MLLAEMFASGGKGVLMLFNSLNLIYLVGDKQFLYVFSFYLLPNQQHSGLGWSPHLPIQTGSFSVAVFMSFTS